MHPTCSVLVLCFFGAGVAVAQVDTSPTFRAEATQGDPKIGRIERITSRGEVQFASGAGGIPPGGLIRLEQQGVASPDFPTGPQVILANGDRIPCQVRGGGDLRLSLETHIAGNKLAKPWNLPIPLVRVLWLEDLPEVGANFPEHYSWLKPDRRHDTILKQNGDVIEGDIVRFADDGKSLVWKPVRGMAEETVDFMVVSCIAMNPRLVTNRPVKGPHAQVVLQGGARMSVLPGESDSQFFVGRSTYGQAIQVPWDQVVSITMRNAATVPLSELKPIRETTEGYGVVTWPWRARMSVKQLPLRVITPAGVSTHDAGVGTHPRAELTYALEGKYSRFQALVGLDGVTGRRGSASVRVLLDQREADLPELKQLLTRPEAVRVAVDVRGVKTMTLRVDFGPTGDIQADVNWVQAELVKVMKTP